MKDQSKENNKLKLVAILLLTTDKSIKAIATECRYKSMSYFLSSFGRVYGVTPKEYRRTQKSNTQ